MRQSSRSSHRRSAWITRRALARRATPAAHVFRRPNTPGSCGCAPSRSFFSAALCLRSRTVPSSSRSCRRAAATHGACCSAPLHGAAHGGSPNPGPDSQPKPRPRLPAQAPTSACQPLSHHRSRGLSDARCKGPRHRTSSLKSSCFFLGVRVREVFSRGGRKTFLSALLRFMCRRASAVHLRESRAWLKVVRVSWHGRWRMRARGAELSSLRALLAGPRRARRRRAAWAACGLRRGAAAADTTHL